MVLEDGSALSGPDAGVFDAFSATGEFQEAMIGGGLRSHQGIAAADIDGDGDADLVSASSDTDAVRLYRNGGQAQTWTAVDVAPPGSIVAFHPAIADLDGDGDLDVVVAALYGRMDPSRSPGQLVWYEQNDGWTRHAVTPATFWGARHVTIGDLTGDGAPDIVVGAIQLTDRDGVARGNGVSWLRNEGGAARFSEPIPVDPELRFVTATSLADVDGDGVLDVVSLGRDSGQVVWYRNERQGVDGAPTFAKHLIGDVRRPVDLSCVNLDDDPAPEIVVVSAAGTVWFDSPADPSGAWTMRDIDSDFGSGRDSRLETADFDGDGRNDVAVAADDASSLRVYFHLASGVWAPILARAGYDGLRDVVAADLDGDGATDLVTSTGQRPAGDRVSWWRNLR